LGPSPLSSSSSSSLPPPPSAESKGREKTRLTKESGDRVDTASTRIGGVLKIGPDPSFLADRAAVYDEVMAAQKARIAAKPRVPIRITLPDGKVIDGTSWETTPMSIAEGISKGLAAIVVVAKVTYSSRTGIEEADGLGMINTGPEEENAEASAAKSELWDLVRPLEGDCKLELLKFDDKDGKMVFWHSSAHVLGECLECGYGAKLCIGPPTEEGFYYDAYMGTK
jgi:threonyl-tRNA synthetase